MSEKGVHVKGKWENKISGLSVKNELLKDKWGFVFVSNKIEYMMKVKQWNFRLARK
ncbi:hypothetical protein MGA3_13756 [Bacillus methanolicus MGA3]|nr:hypothetical protein MGA3_13756 [Bacillus methanolicus MGA3]